MKTPHIPTENSKNSKLPLYEQVRDDLVVQISEGKFASGERLPSEQDLCQYYEVSKITVRRAISELAREGLLYAIQGKGTFVSERRPRVASQGTLRFVRHAFPSNVSQKILRAFEEREQGCRVETVSLALDHSMRELVRGGLGDVFVLREDELPALMAEGALLDLTQFAQRDLDLDDYYPDPFRFCCMNSRLFAFPVNFSPIVMVYNRGHFKEAGLEYPEDWDWDTFLDYARRLTVRGREEGEIARYGFFLRGSVNRWTTFLLQNNGGVFDPSGNFIFDSARSLEALRFCRDLMIKHRVAPVGAPDAQSRPFVTGVASMFLESYYYVHDTEANLEWDMGGLPSKRARATLYLGEYLGVQKNCPDPELAWRLLKAFVTDLGQRQFLEQGQGGPVLRSVVQDGASAWFPKHRDLFWEEMEVARPVYWGNDSTAMKTIVSTAMEMVWSGVETPEGACAEIRRKLDLAEGFSRF